VKSRAPADSALIDAVDLRPSMAGGSQAPEQNGARRMAGGFRQFKVPRSFL